MSRHEGIPVWSPLPFMRTVNRSLEMVVETELYNDFGKYRQLDRRSSLLPPFHWLSPNPPLTTLWSKMCPSLPHRVRFTIHLSSNHYDWASPPPSRAAQLSHSLTLLHETVNNVEIGGAESNHRVVLISDYSTLVVTARVLDRATGHSGL